MNICVASSRNKLDDSDFVYACLPGPQPDAGSCDPSLALLVAPTMICKIIYQGNGNL